MRANFKLVSGSSLITGGLKVSDLAVVGHQEELDVLLPLEDRDALEDRGAEESQVGQVTRQAGLICPQAPPTPERLRPVGGS